MGQLARSGRPGICYPRRARRLAATAQDLERRLDRVADGRTRAPPVPLPAAAAWQNLEPAKYQYHRVAFTAQFDNAREALVYGAASTFRPDVSGPGYWVFTPARLPDGRLVLVDRGFVPEGRQDPDTRLQGQITGPVEITGVMRWPDERHWFTPNDEPNKNSATPEPAAIAAAKHLGPVAPFYIEQESPVPPGGWPKPGKVVVNLPDNHLQYALTWFGLAIVLVISFVTWAFGLAHAASEPADGKRRQM